MALRAHPHADSPGPAANSSLSLGSSEAGAPASVSGSSIVSSVFSSKYSASSSAVT